MPRRVAIIGAGVSGLGCVWALDNHPDRFDSRIFEAAGRIGGNAVTADMEQDDGSAIPFDDEEARKWFDFYGRMKYGRRLRKA